MPFQWPDIGLPPGCATDTQVAKALPLDIYLMLDSSASMLESTGTGTSSPTKWEAVNAAITSFMNDPKSAGIGLGLQYFPLIVPGTASQRCANDAVCGTLSPCIDNRACAMSGIVTYCEVDGDCPSGVTCDDLGACAISSEPCFRSFGCPAGAGSCNLFAFSYCSGRDICTPSDYAAPAVPIDLLPGVATTIADSLSIQWPDGLTPTGPALDGAIYEAKTYAFSQPGHTVIAVLATDGFPTECSPQDIPSIAQIASSGVNGSPSIKTFVVGVFGPADTQQATQNLDQIAQAGGTQQAFVIDSSQDVTQAFLAALNQIRGSALPCDYELPVPESGTPDYGQVNVQFTSGSGGAWVIPNVADASSCDPKRGGWYYDVDPAQGMPTRSILCPVSCVAVKSDPSGRIDVVQGCETIIF